MKISIIGGGIGGLCTAIALQKKGFEAYVFERSSEIKPLGAGLALGANAIKAFKELGIDDQIIEVGKVLRFLSILDEQGKVISKRDTRALSKHYGVDNFTIHRSVLQNILIKSLQPGTLLLNYNLRSLNNIGEKIAAEFTNGQKIESDILIGADGIHSQVRKIILPGILPRYSGYTCWRAVVEKDPESFDPDSFSETWGANGRFGIVPLSKNKIYWYACLNAPQNDPIIRKYGVKELAEVFKDFHEPVEALIRLTREDQLIQGDIIDLSPLDRFAFGRVLLIGDAAHATTPNIGQGACQAIEDAVFLSKCIVKYKAPELAFQKFEALRLKRTKKIVQSSWSIGKFAQMSNPILCKMRNTLLRWVPERINKKQLSFLYDIDFDNF